MPSQRSVARVAGAFVLFVIIMVRWIHSQDHGRKVYTLGPGDAGEVDHGVLCYKAAARLAGQLQMT